MNSRRRFLQSAPAYAAASLAARPAVSKENSGQSITAKRDYWNDFPDHLSRVVNAARLRRKAELEKIGSAEAAQKRNAFVVEKVWELIGGPLEKTPLNPMLTGTVQRKGYRIEKVVFESQPKFYVTAHLYLPESSGPVPGILAALGHAPEGKAYQSYQTVFQNLAKKGFAVLAWDPPGQGERFQYLDSTRKKSRLGPTGEHDRFGWPALLLGSTTTQFEVVDGIRALDYLLSRPEIDAARIGCCGHSGGGTQTMYLCALEPRIKVAVVVEGHTENLSGAEYQPPGAFADAEQNLIGGLAAGVDRGDLLCAFAPKPLLICYTPIDEGTTYSPHYVAGNEEIHAELEHVYGVYGAKEKTALSASTLPHDYDYFHRRATYQWFNQWLRDGQGKDDEAAFEDAPEAALWCTSSGQVLTSLGGRAAFQVNLDRLRVYQAASMANAGGEQLRKELRETLALAESSGPVKGKTLSERRIRNVVVEDFEFESEPGIRVPGWFIKPANGGPAFPVVIVLSDQGKDELFDEFELVERLAGKGQAVCSVDLRTSGVTTPRLPSQGPLFYGSAVEMAYSLVSLGVGSPIIGQQTFDLLRTLDYLEGRKDADMRRAALFVNGRSGLAGLFGTALDGRIGSLLLNGALVSFESVVESEDYSLALSSVAFGFLKKFDLPDICAAIAPRPVWFANSCDARGNTLPLTEMQARYQRARHAYEAASQPNQLTFLVEPGDIEKVVMQWADKAL